MRIPPLYVTVPVRDRHEMIAALVGQLVEQVGEPEQIFIFDNESNPPQPMWGDVRPIHAPNRTVCRMWNDGLDLAEEHARSRGHKEWNVAVLNSDLRLRPNTLHTLARGLRSRPGVAIAYPNLYGIPYKEIGEVDNPNYAGQTMAGYCWMLAGETGLRCDEQFQYWYFDSDIERQARKAGYNVICVGACREPEHLDPGGHISDPGRLEQIHADEARFAAKWGVDPDSLFLAMNPGWTP